MLGKALDVANTFFLSTGSFSSGCSSSASSPSSSSSSSLSSSLVSVKSGVYPTLVGSWDGNEGPALSPPGTRRSGNGIPDLKGGGALVEPGGPLAGPCNLNGLWGIATGF